MIRSKLYKGKVYKFVHHSDVWIKTNLKIDAFEGDWIIIDESGKITVKGSLGNGYAWDGCTPKANFLDIIWGTPDGKLDYDTEKPITYYASMIHDAIYENRKKIGVSRREADIIFKLILKDASFKLWWLYYFGVRMGGVFFGSWNKKKGKSSIVIESFSWRNDTNVNLSKEITE